MAKQHDKQFKLDAVQYYQDHKDLGVRGCAENLGIGYSTLTKWLKDFRESGDIPARFRQDRCPAFSGASHIPLESATRRGTVVPLRRLFLWLSLFPFFLAGVAHLSLCRHGESARCTTIILQRAILLPTRRAFAKQIQFAKGHGLISRQRYSITICGKNREVNDNPPIIAMKYWKIVEMDKMIWPNMGSFKFSAVLLAGGG